MTRRVMLAVFATLVVFPLQVLAHPGHAHEILGTVTTVTATSVEVLDRGRTPGESAEFGFIGRNPKTSESIVWKAHRGYADGTASHRIGEPGTRNPAPIATLAATSQDDAAA